MVRRRRELSGEPDPKAGERELRKAQKRIRELGIQFYFGELVLVPRCRIWVSREKPPRGCPCPGVKKGALN